MADHPPADKITLDDIDAYSLVLEASCPECKGLRRIKTFETVPGFSAAPPLAERFADGKVKCRVHGKVATRLRITETSRVMGEHPVVAEWVAG